MASFRSRIAAAAIIAATLISNTSAQEYKIGNITIDHPVARATAPGQKVGGGYATIVNAGTSDDKLIGGTAEFAGTVEIHQMKMVDDVMQMKQLGDGLPVPAGETVKLMPGSYHIMFMQLKEALAEGETRKVKLTFEKAGEIEVEFQVKSIADTMKMKKEGDS